MHRNSSSAGEFASLAGIFAHLRGGLAYTGTEHGAQVLLMFEAGLFCDSGQRYLGGGQQLTCVPDPDIQDFLVD
jgi:hypothetical protein